MQDGVILADDPAPKLSDYGFFARRMRARACCRRRRPYDLVNPLFSDHAGKHRLVYVPKGQSAAYNPDSVFDFPVGSVLIKTFAFAPTCATRRMDERYGSRRGC